MRFNGTNAKYPLAGMILAGDGNLYGVTSDANRQLTADGNGGLFFRLVEPPSTTLNLSNGSIQLSWTSFTNAVYNVDFKSSLTDATWTVLASNITATGNSTMWIDPATSANRFYRIVLLP